MNQSIIYILFGLLFAIVNGANFIGCNAKQQSQVYSAIPAAHNYAAGAVSYLNSHESGTSRYTTWFGTFDSLRHSGVTNHFNRIARNNFASYTYDCSTCTKPNVYAYVRPLQFGYIYLCEGFWPAPTTGTDSKAGKIISMASQFTENGGIKEIVHGQANCRQYAVSNPPGAAYNADSHEYFAENNPFLA